MSSYFKIFFDTLSAYKWWTRVVLERYCRKRKKVNLSNRHIALLAWTFPPNVNGGTYRPAALVKYGTELGWRFSVISGPITNTPDSAGIYLLNSLPSEIHIARLAPPQITPSWNWFPNVDGGFFNALATFSLAQKIFEHDPPSIVMASGPTFHNFIAAFYIARYYGSKLVLDYRDEWTIGTRSFISIRNSDHRWEPICLQKADAVFFVTKTFSELYINNFPQLDPTKCSVILNGWDPSEFITADKILKEDSRKNAPLLISHLGTLGDHMLPEDFLDALADVLARRKDLREYINLRFVGKINDKAKEQLSQFPYQEILNVTEGYVTKPIAIRMMKDSSALLIINGSINSRCLPSKLYEYLAAGPPILSIGEEGETGRLIKELNAGLLVPTKDSDALERALDILVTGKDLKRDLTKINKWLDLHTREKMTQRMVEVFEKLTLKN